MHRPKSGLALALALLAAGCGDIGAHSTEDKVATNEDPALMEPATSDTENGIGAAAEKQSALPALSGEGIQMVNPETGSAAIVAFGTDREQAITALDRSLAGQTRTSSTNSECGAGSMEFVAWSGGLTALFQDSKFAGWALNENAEALTTMSGIGIGSSRKELESAYNARIFASSLGTEFTAGDISGLLDGDGEAAKITNLWAGTSCNFR